MRNSTGFLHVLGAIFGSVSRYTLRILIGFYRVALAPSFGGACRFEPSCSIYAERCIQTHTPFAALKLIVRRLLKCRPGGPFGFDEVPGDKIEGKL